MMKLPILLAATARHSTGGEPSETVVRSDKGVKMESAEQGVPNFGIAGVSVAAGSWLIVSVAYNDPVREVEPTGELYDGVAMPCVLTVPFLGNGMIVKVYALYCPSAHTGGIIVPFDNANPTLCLMTAVEVAGLASPALDTTKSGSGSGTAVSSGASAAAVQNHEYCHGLVVWVKNTAPDISYGNSFLAGQKVAGFEDGESVECALYDCGKVITGGGAQTLTATLPQSAAWAAHLLMFKAA